MTGFSVALDLTFATNDFAQIVADLPESVTVGGVTGNAVMDDDDTEETLDLEASAVNRMARFFLPVSTWATAPSIGAELTARGKTFRVQRVSESADGVSWNLDAVEVTGG